MAKPVNDNKIPLAIIILNLQNYNFDFFDLDEVVFFEWLIVKGKAFHFKEFFYSGIRIKDETGIKKDALNSILTRFVNLGIVSIRKFGYPPVSHFTVHYDVMLTLVPQFADSRKSNEEFRQRFADFLQTLAENRQQKKSIKNNKRSLEDNYEWKGMDSKISEKEILPTDLLNTNSNQNQNQKNKTLPGAEIGVKNLVAALAVKFAERKDMALSKSKKHGRDDYSFNPPPIVKEKIAEARTIYSDSVIGDSFIAFCDAVLNGKITIRKQLLSYFFSKAADGSFDVIESYNSIFATNYTIG